MVSILLFGLVILFIVYINKGKVAERKSFSSIMYTAFRKKLVPTNTESSELFFKCLENENTGVKVILSPTSILARRYLDEIMLINAGFQIPKADVMYYLIAIAQYKN